MNFFNAHAESITSVSTQGSPYSLIIMLLIFALIFYFMIIRPKQKSAKDHKKLMESISKGDEVMTVGGLIGRVTKIAEGDYVIIALNENNEIVMKRNFITAILPKGTMKAL